MPDEKVLYLVRHAEAAWPESGQRDFDRTLTSGGGKEAQKMGRLLKTRAVVPQLLLSSPAIRAVQTAERIAGELTFPKERIVFDPRIYEASVSDLFQILLGIEDQYASVLMVAHNPALTELIHKISSGLIGNAPPGAVATIRISSLHWMDLRARTGTLSNYDVP
jgi:phosphohistidine phosphatase